VAFREVVGLAVAWSGSQADGLVTAKARALCFLGLRGYPQQYGPAS
jgi:hypothetical protein